MMTFSANFSLPAVFNAFNNMTQDKVSAIQIWSYENVDHDPQRYIQS